MLARPPRVRPPLGAALLTVAAAATVTVTVTVTVGGCGSSSPTAASPSVSGVSGVTAVSGVTGTTGATRSAGETSAPVSASPAPALPPPSTSASPACGHGTDGCSPTPTGRLGHYSSRDGLFGMVLDRTVDPPRARVDGHPEVVELAIRRLGSESILLVSPHLDLTLEVRSDGRMTVSADGLAANRETWLLRDADVHALGTPVREAPADAVALATQALQAACGASPKLDFLGPLRPEEAAGAVATTWRTVQALQATCRDALGQRALAKEVQRVRIGAARANAFALHDGTLVVQGDLSGESRGPFSDEIQHFVESKL